MTWVWVVLGGAVGAPTRYLLDAFVQRRHEADFPWGTFTVNVLASFVLGLVSSGSGVPDAVALAVGTGFCGALSTYSTFAYENARLITVQKSPTALLNTVLSLVVGLAAVYAGIGLGGLLT